MFAFSRKQCLSSGHSGFCFPLDTADANQKRNWRVYSDLAQVLISIARPMYGDEPLVIELDYMVYDLDAATIDMCITLWPWAPFQRSRGAVKLHTLLDPRGSVHTFIAINDARSNDVAVLGQCLLRYGPRLSSFQEAVSTASIGRAFCQSGWAQHPILRQYSRPVDRQTGLRTDHTIRLTVKSSHHTDPESLRCFSYLDTVSRNSSSFSPTTSFYRLNRWPICSVAAAALSLFFKSVKQHLGIQSFSGNSENAVKTQIEIAVSVYPLVDIAKKEIGIEAVFTLSYRFRDHPFEKSPILQVLSTLELQFTDPYARQCSRGQWVTAALTPSERAVVRSVC